MLQYLRIGNFEIPMYGLMIMIGAVLAVAFAMRRAKQTTVDPDDVLYSITYTAIGVILGAKLLYVIVSWNDLAGNWSYYFSSFKAFREFIGYGFVFYGGLIGGLAVFIPYCIKKKLNLGEMINCVVPSIPLIHSIGRVGCFFAGCCYGIPMDPPWGVYFRSSLAPHGVALFPVQLLEAALNLVLFCILYTYARKPRKPGKVLGYYLVAYGIERFFLEFLRGDLERGSIFGISTSQFISLILIPLGLILAFVKFEEKIGMPALAGPGALTKKQDDVAETPEETRETVDEAAAAAEETVAENAETEDVIPDEEPPAEEAVSEAEEIEEAIQEEEEPEEEEPAAEEPEEEREEEPAEEAEPEEPEEEETADLEEAEETADETAEEEEPSEAEEPEEAEAPEAEEEETPEEPSEEEADSAAEQEETEDLPSEAQEEEDPDGEAFPAGDPFGFGETDAAEDPFAQENTQEHDIF